ncbi:MAG: DUF1956 domain-containing protein [Planctomycetales bacterium]
MASVNYYFGDKEQLYIEAVRQAHQLRAQQVPAPLWPDGTPTATKLRDFIQMLLTRMIGFEDDPWPTQLMMREVLNPTKACEAMVEDYFRPHLNLLGSILDEVLPTGTPSYKRMQISFSVVGQCLYYRVAGGVAAMLVSEQEYQDFYSLDQLADHITQVTLAALGLAPPLGQPKRP